MGRMSSNAFQSEWLSADGGYANCCCTVTFQWSEHLGTQYGIMEILSQAPKLWFPKQEYKRLQDVQDTCTLAGRSYQARSDVGVSCQKTRNTPPVNPPRSPAAALLCVDQGPSAPSPSCIAVYLYGRALALDSFRSIASLLSSPPAPGMLAPTVSTAH